MVCHLKDAHSPARGKLNDWMAIFSAFFFDLAHSEFSHFFPGYQNFFICIEMFFGAIALRFAFPSNIYKDGQITQQVIEVSDMTLGNTGFYFFFLCVNCHL